MSIDGTIYFTSRRFGETAITVYTDISLEKSRMERGLARRLVRT